VGRWTLLFIAVVVAGATASCGSDEGDSSGSQGISAATGQSIRTISISETEFKLSPAKVQVDTPGTYTFHVVNDGTTTHALEVEGHGVETETESISPGSSADLRIDVPEEGDYELYCPIGNHRDRGMEGTLTVGTGVGARGTTTTDDSDSGGLGY
jgi:uncharacterized cupredoxin-like copper-binding protein